MPVLCVKVFEAKLVGVDASTSSYVSVKFKQVQSSSRSIKGLNPKWNEEFTFETERVHGGLLLELHSKGLLWSKLLGALWMPLPNIILSNKEVPGLWSILNAEVVTDNGIPVGTKTPTQHTVLASFRLEGPNVLPIGLISSQPVDQRIVPVTTFPHITSARDNHCPNGFLPTSAASESYWNRPTIDSNESGRSPWVSQSELPSRSTAHDSCLTSGPFRWSSEIPEAKQSRSLNQLAHTPHPVRRRNLPIHPRSTTTDGSESPYANTWFGHHHLHNGAEFDYDSEPLAYNSRPQLGPDRGRYLTRMSTGIYEWDDEPIWYDTQVDDGPVDHSSWETHSLYDGVSSPIFNGRQFYTEPEVIEDVTRSDCEFYEADGQLPVLLPDSDTSWRMAHISDPYRSGRSPVHSDIGPQYDVNWHDWCYGDEYSDHHPQSDYYMNDARGWDEARSWKNEHLTGTRRRPGVRTSPRYCHPHQLAFYHPDFRDGYDAAYVTTSEGGEDMWQMRDEHSASNYYCSCESDYEVDTKIISFDRTRHSESFGTGFGLEPTTPSGDVHSLALSRSSSPTLSRELRLRFDRSDFLSNADDFRASAEAAVANSVPPGEHPADLHFVSSNLSDLPPPTSQPVVVTSASTHLPSSVSSQRSTTPVLSSTTTVNVSEPMSPSTEQKVRVALARDSFRQSSEKTRHSRELSRPTAMVPTTPTENHNQLLLETDALLAKYASPQLTQEQKPSLLVQSAYDLQYSSPQPAKSPMESGKPPDSTSSSILGSNSNLSRFWNDLSAFKPVPRSSAPRQPSPKPSETTPVSTSQLTQMLIGRIFGSIPNVSGVIATTSNTASTTSLTSPFSGRPALDRTPKNNEHFVKTQTVLNNQSTSVSNNKAPIPSVVGHKESNQAVPYCTADKFDTFVTTSLSNRFVPITNDLKASKIVIETPAIPLPWSEDKVTGVSSTTRDVTNYVEHPVEVPRSDFPVKEGDAVPPKPSLLTSSSLDDTYGFNKLPPFSAEEHLRQLRIRAGLESSPQLDLRSESITHGPSIHLSPSSNVLSIKLSVPNDQPVNIKSSSSTGFGFIDLTGVQSRATNLMPKFSSDKLKSTSISTPSIPDLFASIKTGFDSGLGSVNRKAHQSQQQPQQQRQATSSVGFSFGSKSSATGLLGNLLSSAASKAQTVAAGAIKQANAAADAAKEAATQAVGQLATAQATVPPSGSRTSSTSHGSFPHYSQPPVSAHTLVPPRVPSELCLVERQPLTRQQEPSHPPVRLQLDDHELSPTLNGRPIPVGQEAPEHPSTVSIRRDSSERRQSLFVPQERRWLHEQTMDMTTDDDYDDDAYERRETTPEVGDHYDPSQEEFTAGSDAEPISFVRPTGISNAEQKPANLNGLSDGSLDSDAVCALHARDKMLMAAATGIHSPAALGPGQPG
ncbi:hypothetical protein EG68_06494 [Paragonimus skrjabini miyazakii]|uniref:C2 domain-containing protein n=1 Tax=Paragonimus skrjabini miyazakii TaxID=59628 RepID=A0A8S9YTP2_9TREM|nr:hypothetical protein EG68_06494 [Paragonimus skrjabini miyazakii]